MDTSVWVEHFRHGEPELMALLEEDRVLVHPMVLGEIACGTPPARTQTLTALRSQQQPAQASLSEVIDFIDRRKLYGQGCGLVDACLLASTLMTPNARLWTRETALARLAKQLGVAWKSTLH